MVRPQGGHPLSYGPSRMARLSQIPGRMSQNKGHAKSSRSATSPAKAAKRVVKKAAHDRTTAMTVVANKVAKHPRVARHASAAAKKVSGRTKRFLRSKPVAILLGASALGLVIAKLKHVLA